QIAITIEICVSQAASNSRLAKIGAGFLCDVAKSSFALIQKQLRGLSVSDIPADVSHGLVDVPVGKREVESSVEVEIGEDTSEAQHAFRGIADASRDGNVIIGALAAGPKQPCHFVVEVSNCDALHPAVGEVTGVNTHSSASFAVNAECYASV